MKNLIIISILIYNVSLIAQNKSKTCTLTVNLTNFEESGKYVQVGLYNSKANWLKINFLGKKVLVENGKAVVIFKKLPLGVYAISCFFDLNDNDDLDSGFMGIPKEPFAFSNSASAFFGPPSWEKASFTLASDKKEVSIKF